MLYYEIYGVHDSKKQQQQQKIHTTVLLVLANTMKTSAISAFVTQLFEPVII